ncbi:MAG TPA: ThiF family adenylyltransferase [Acidobacteriota bacterium]|nr:ThiF family adenylyltransferase [Acidobacteriota bacterium]
MQDRYSRQIRFAPLGRKGQERLQASQVAIVGCGALGTASADMLARAGVGCLRIIDRDFVEASNLQRQTLFTESDARQRLPKAQAARKALTQVNSDIEVDALCDDLDYRNIASLVEGCHLLIDGTDNFETRFLLNDWSVSQGVPWIYGAALGSYGVAAAIDVGQPGDTTPCLRCLMEELPAAGSVETCETAGILGPTVQAVASFQASQALRRLAGHDFVPVMLRVDVWEGYWRSSDYLALKNPDCPCCAGEEFPYLGGEAGDRSARLCGRNAVQIRPSRLNSGEGPLPVDFDLLLQRLPEDIEVQRNPFLMRLRLDGHEIHLFPDGRAIITGTDDVATARSLYARYVGS